MAEYLLTAVFPGERVTTGRVPCPPDTDLAAFLIMLGQSIAKYGGIELDGKDKTKTVEMPIHVEVTVNTADNHDSDDKQGH